MAMRGAQATASCDDEATCLEETKALITSLVACVAYIREFFPDEAFDECKYGEMTLKYIKRHVHPHADRLLDWIEKGCFEALSLKYLETISLGIFDDPDHPESVLESYTLHVSYPSSKMHRLVEESRSAARSKGLPPVGLQLTLETGGGKSSSVIGGGGGSQESSVKEQIVKILRTICVLMQTLHALPRKKFVTMQMTFWDELTPVDYEPAGFASAAFDFCYLFPKATPPLKQAFGPLVAPHHRVAVLLETIADRPLEGHVTTETVPDAIPKVLAPPSRPPSALDRKAGLDSHVPTDSFAAIINDGAPARKRRAPPLPPAATDGGLAAAAERADLSSGGCEGGTVRCSCGEDVPDLDMILCDGCQTWGHTPCAGYCSNRDQRIPPTHLCFACEFSGKKKLLSNVGALSSFRRAISVVYSEGLPSISWLSRRLSCGIRKATTLIRRLEGEGFIMSPPASGGSHPPAEEGSEAAAGAKRPSRVGAYTVVKSAASKERIRHFFNRDLSTFPSLALYFGRGAGSNGDATKRAPPQPSDAAAKARKVARKSVAIEKISCN